MAPTRRQRLFLFPKEEAEIGRYSNLCQICATRLLIWAIWPIWGDERTVSYVGSMEVGVPIPSLATTFSIAYDHAQLGICSILFQKLIQACPSLSPDRMAQFGSRP
jgi:hypothetical protein